MNENINNRISRKDFLKKTSILVGGILLKKDTRNYQNKIELNIDELKAKIEQKHSVKLNDIDLINEQFVASSENVPKYYNLMDLGIEELTMLDFYLQDLKDSGLRDKAQGLLNIFIGITGNSPIDNDSDIGHYIIPFPFMHKNEKYEGSIRINSIYFKKAVDLEVSSVNPKENGIKNKVNWLGDTVSAFTHEFCHLLTLKPDKAENFTYSNNLLFNLLGIFNDEQLYKKFKLIKNNNGNGFKNFDRWTYAGVSRQEFWAVIITSYTYGEERFRNEYSKYFSDKEVDIIIKYLQSNFFGNKSFKETITEPNSYESIPLRLMGKDAGSELFYKREAILKATQRLSKKFKSLI